MKKRVLALLLSCVLCVGLIGTASAKLVEKYDEEGNSLGFFEEDETPPPEESEAPPPSSEPTPPPSQRPTYPSSGWDYTPSNPSYSVTAPSSTSGGKVSLSTTSAKKGDTVTVTVTPDKGYKLDKLTVTDSKGNVIQTLDQGNGKYAFTMPDGKVDVSATFVAIPQITFTDVAPGAYYADAVAWAVEKGITNGTSADTFSPNQTCTRAQTVTFLWRAAGSPAPHSTSNPFTDVNPGEYYYSAVLWAVEQGITNGTGAATFSPNDTVTRGQTVTFQYRAAKAQGTSGNNPFVDVAAGEYYAEAVQWAVNRGVTNGTSATTFSPNEGCTRGQIVTFLYRDMA